MIKKSLLLFSLTLFISCVQNVFAKEGSSKILVAYYSQTGNTKRAAEKIANLTNANLFEIIPETPYPENHDPCLEKQINDIKTNARPKIKNWLSDINSYDTIFVGYPIWYYQAPLVINTFLESYNLSGKKVIPFCTSGGYPIANSIKELKPSAPNALWQKGLRVSGRQNEVESWLEELNMKTYKIKITANGKTLSAILEDNATSRDLIKKMPLTLNMMDLYNREMCYRFGRNGLATEELRSDGYKIGDIAYWPPAGSLVILYRQNGEEFERAHLGNIESGVELFETTGNTRVTFELAE